MEIYNKIEKYRVILDIEKNYFKKIIWFFIKYSLAMK